ncbi:MAG: succinate dehydrogenase/fumarate reductase flavoprotein subunit, partial [Myxococcota bacterium]
LGAEVVLNQPDNGAGTVRRIHVITNGGPGPIGLLIPLVEADTWLDTEATGLLTDPSGAVVGASFVRTDGSGEGFIAAGAVVVATGGFARDVARVIADRPGLAGVDFVAEAAHSTDGGGHGMLEALGVPLGGPGSQGVYVQSIADLREPGSLEALWPTGLSTSVIVDSAGQRQVDESQVGDLTRIDWLLADPDKRLWAVMREERLRVENAMVPAYNWAALGAPESLSGDEVIEALSLSVYASPGELAAGEGIDVDGLATTIVNYDVAAEAGVDPLGKDAMMMEPLGGHALLALPLAPGAAKSFGGVSTTVSGAVLGGDGVVIPGLFAAGEVAGMLGTVDIGRGFAGSVTACYLGGLIAGEAAAQQSR